MAEEGKADWEIRLGKYFEEPVSEAKVDGTFSGSQLQSLLIDIEKVVGEAKKFLAANMISEVRAQLDKIRSLLRFLEKRAPESIDEVASLLKAGVSEKILKEIYGVTDEEIQRAKKLLETSTKAQEEPITMQRIRCSNLYQALRALEPVLARAREKGESELESAVSRAMELIAKKLEECPSEWYMESSGKHSSSSSNPDGEEQEYERLREKARLARAESLI
jgi:hypothetical protein